MKMESAETLTACNSDKFINHILSIADKTIRKYRNYLSNQHRAAK